jgi:two-component system, NarL family, response regulator YdfI
MTQIGKNGSGSVRVLLASASVVRRAGLEALVKSAAWLKLVGSLSSPKAISQRAVELASDVALVDLEHESALPLSIEFIFPLVVLIDDPDPGWSAQALRLGAKAILNRDIGAEAILSTIKAAHSGLVLLSDNIVRNLADRVYTPSKQLQSPLERLTPRELEVLTMLAEGLGNRRIADRLGLSDHTVKFHIGSILDKLDARTRTEAVTTALRMGLIVL